MRRLAKVPGLDRIRYTTSHPRDMDEALIAAHAEVEALMPYLHLPVQAGSDRILKAMNRGHTAEHYLRLVDQIRAARPDIALSGDFIVGFPGETDADFEQTLEVVRAANYASAFSFKYSRRPGTPASAMPGQVAEEVKDARLQRLQALLETQRQSFNGAMAGRTVPVLFERPGRHAGQILGRSPYLQAVHVEAPERLLGQIVPVRIASARSARMRMARLAPARPLASPRIETPPPGVSTSTWKASSMRAAWRLCGPATARTAASDRGRNSSPLGGIVTRSPAPPPRSGCWSPPTRS